MYVHILFKTIVLYVIWLLYYTIIQMPHRQTVIFNYNYTSSHHTSDEKCRNVWRDDTRGSIWNNSVKKFVKKFNSVFLHVSRLAWHRFATTAMDNTRNSVGPEWETASAGPVRATTREAAAAIPDFLIKNVARFL